MSRYTMSKNDYVSTGGLSPRLKPGGLCRGRAAWAPWATRFQVSVEPRGRGLVVSHGGARSRHERLSERDVPFEEGEDAAEAGDLPVDARDDVETAPQLGAPARVDGKGDQGADARVLGEVEEERGAQAGEEPQTQAERDEEEGHGDVRLRVREDEVHRRLGARSHLRTPREREAVSTLLKLKSADAEKNVETKSCTAPSETCERVLRVFRECYEREKKSGNWTDAVEGRRRRP